MIMIVIGDQINLFDKRRHRDVRILSQSAEEDEKKQRRPLFRKRQTIPSSIIL